MKRGLSVLAVGGALLLGSMLIAGCAREAPRAPTRAPGAEAMKAAAEKLKATQKPKPAKVVYTCPMHPEVTSDKPGKCPKCGMNLVPKK
jgi:rubrerythrin